MSTLALVALLSASVVLSALAVWVSIRLAYRLRLLDEPDGERKTQDRGIPKMGGVAVAVAFIAVTIGGLLALGRADLIAPTLGILVPALGLAVLGLVDDVRGLGPGVRLLLQAALAVLAFGLGTRIELTHLPILNAILTVGFIIVVVNGVNLLDNSDGLAASTVLVSASGACVIALIFGQDLVALLGCALVGVALGFLWHNWFPARVYLGDSGAYLLGFLLAVLVIRLRPEPLSPALAAVIALLLVALPLLDTSYVVIRRIRAGVHPFTAGRDHLAHALQARGRSVPASVLVLQVVPGAAAVLALALTMVAVTPAR